MSATEKGFDLICGTISQDEEGCISIPLNGSYSLICESYTVSRENKLSETACISQNSFTSLKSTGTLTIKAKGEVIINEDSSFISTAAELSKNTTPFILIIGSQIYHGMLMKSFSAKIDGYGRLAVCSAEFVQLSGESYEQ